MFEKAFAWIDQHGVRDDTIVVFTSDDGPWWVGDTGGMRGRKGEAYDGGIKVPMVVEWPAGMRHHGRVYDRPKAHVDLLPTICAAVGVPLTDRPIDGQDLLPATQTGRRMPPTPIADYQSDTLNAFRDGDWKLHVRRVTGVLPRFTGRLGRDATEEMPHRSTTRPATAPDRRAAPPCTLSP